MQKSVHPCIEARPELVEGGEKDFCMRLKVTIKFRFSYPSKNETDTVVS